MSRFLFFLMALSLGSALGQVPPGPIPAERDLGVQDVAWKQVQQAVRGELADKQIPAISILVFDGQRQREWSGGYSAPAPERPAGSAPNTDKPVTARSIYRVGSISKLFTDLAVMQLVDDGVLSLDTPWTDYLPSVQPRNPFGARATLRDLMTHRSGLVREPPIGNYFDPEEPTLLDTVNSLNDTELVYAPGTRTKYSNAAIAVVGRILETVTGKPFDVQLTERVLTPLGMHYSSFERTEQVRMQLVPGWMWTYDGRRFLAPAFALGTVPAGNLYASAQELRPLMELVIGRGEYRGMRLLSEAGMAAMCTPHADAGEANEFGIGFHLSRLDGHASVEHGGAVYGYATHLQILPDAKLGVVVIAALDGANGVTERLGQYALRCMLAERAAEPVPDYPVAEPLPVERLGELIGEYADGEDHARMIASGGTLTWQDGVFRRQVRSSGEDLVLDDLFGRGPSFARLPDGTLRFPSRTFQRVDHYRPPTSATSLPQAWRDVIGEYGWDHNTLYLREDRGRLHALIEWFYDYPLTAINDSEFAFPDYGLYQGERLTVHRNPQGVVSHVVAAAVKFPRRAVGAGTEGMFRIEPVSPLDELRVRARQAAPPDEPPPARPSELVELSTLDPTIKLDIRYATSDNFLGVPVYEEARAFLQRPAANALLAAHQRLGKVGFGLLIHDAYRPWFVTKIFWDATPAAYHDFVANPANGSRHNRGCAVDLTLYRLDTGEPVTMVSGYDEFSPRAFPDYPGGTEAQRWHRQLLRDTMESVGFTVYEYEWWHFDYRDWRDYAIQNVEFGETSRKAN